MRKFVLMCVLVSVCLSLLLIPSTFARNEMATAAADTTAPVVWIVSPTDGSQRSQWRRPGIRPGRRL
jgi:hypothetical protein